MVSTASRRKMAQAQKARWAKAHKESQPAATRTLGLGSGEAQNVTCGPQEDRGVSAGAVGEDTGEAEKGGLEPKGPRGIRVAGFIPSRIAYCALPLTKFWVAATSQTG
jgi:hypothetical protein